MVRRYDLEDKEDGSVDLVERKHGDWVAADDYDSVLDERDNLRRLVADAIELLRTA